MNSMALAAVNQKISIKENTLMDPAAAGLRFCFLPQSSQRAQRNENQFNGNLVCFKVRSLVIGERVKDEKTEDRRQMTEEKREIALKRLRF